MGLFLLFMEIKSYPCAILFLVFGASQMMLKTAEVLPGPSSLTGLGKKGGTSKPSPSNFEGV